MNGHIQPPPSTPCGQLSSISHPILGSIGLRILEMLGGFLLKLLWRPSDSASGIGRGRGGEDLMVWFFPDVWNSSATNAVINYRWVTNKMNCKLVFIEWSSIESPHSWCSIVEWTRRWRRRRRRRRWKSAVELSYRQLELDIAFPYSVSHWISTFSGEDGNLVWI